MCQKNNNNNKTTKNNKQKNPPNTHEEWFIKWRETSDILLSRPMSFIRSPITDILQNTKIFFFFFYLHMLQ